MPGEPGLSIGTYTAAPGTQAADKLTLRASSAATTRAETEQWPSGE